LPAGAPCAGIKRMVAHLNRRNIVAVIWDFDKTLTPGYMQAPLFQRYGIDEAFFWKEVNALPAIYAERGIRVSQDTVYLNHLLSFIKNGPMKGLRNRDLRALGEAIPLFPGLPDFFLELKAIPHSRPEFSKHDIHLEHYIVSTGLAEMIRGSAVAKAVDDIFACEFVEDPLPPYYTRQCEFPMDPECEISQIGTIVDNTIKTRYIFEINKGSNKHPNIDVNAKMAHEDRRVPIENMIYIADGPSDVPVFSVVNRGGGKTFAVYNPQHSGEFAQNDALQQDGRVDSYGPADYTPNSQTGRWLYLQVERICERIVSDREALMAQKISRPPRHLHAKNAVALDAGETQGEFFEEPKG